jgi:site-specific recombinase XerD
LDYLKRARPQSNRREVFLGIYAPHNPFSCGSSLASMIQHRVRRAGITTKGRHGAHALRFARAIGLLRVSVPVKTIGDLLGHQSADSTGVYLRLAEDDLRAISLEIPQ